MIKVNGKEIEITKFPNGESLVNVEYLNTIGNGANVVFKWHNDEDILHLYFVLAHLIYHGVSKRNIYICYMPYSRMDRDQNGNCFTLSHVTRILNEVITSDDEIYIAEPHSDVTLYQLNKAHRFNVITPIMKKVLSEQSIDIICYPDKGARNRFASDEIGLPIVYCNKVRDFNTGVITGLDLVAEESVQGKNILILDDLCSKGGTFYYTAKKLKEEGANNIYLGLCHMESTVKYGNIWSDGQTNLDSLVKHIYCTNSMLFNTDIVLDGTNITVYDIEELMLNNNLVEVHKEGMVLGGTTV